MHRRSTPPGTGLTPPRWVAAATAIALAAGALALYLRTLLPDFGGPEDSPKFQFLGAVLGTAHQPGYPLYVALSWLFGHLPAGTTAYRVNLLSAVCGSLTVLTTVLLARSVRLGGLASALGAAGLATGLWFWWYSVLAEVYTLGALLVALTALLLVQWNVRQRNGWLYATALSAGVAAAHHPVAYGVLPACLAFVVLLRGIRRVPVRAALGCGALFLAGFTPYLLVILRTRAPARYLETTAVHLVDLVGVFRLQRWSGTNFAFDPLTLVTLRLPRLAAILTEELGVSGVVLLLCGATVAVLRRSPGLMLALGSALGMLLLILPTVGDTRGLVVVAAPFLWVVSAGGADALIRLASRWRFAGAATATLALALVPGLALASHWHHNDLSRQWLDARYFRSLCDATPHPATLVFEDYWVEMMRLYPLMAERPAGSPLPGVIPKDPRRVRAVLARGEPVFAFDRGAGYLASAGFVVRPVPVRAPDLTSFLGALPAGATVVALVSGCGLPSELQRLGQTASAGARPLAARPRRFEAVAGVVAGPALGHSSGDERVELRASSAEPRGSPARLPPLAAVADGTGARIEVAGSPIVESDDGLLLAVLDVDGRVLAAEAFTGGSPVRPALPAVRRLSRVEAALECVTLTPGRWTDLREVARAGVIGAFVGPGAAFALDVEAAGTTFLDPSVAVPFGEAAAHLVHVSDPPASPSVASGSSRRFTVAVGNTAGASAVQVRFGGVPEQARARLEARGALPSPVEVCAVAAQLPDRTNGGGLTVPVDDDVAFGAGWGLVERDAATRLRWTTGDVSTLLIPVDSPTDHEVMLDVRPGLAGASLALWVNGASPDERRLADGWQRVSWRLPAAALRTGTNELGLVHRPPGVLRHYGEGTHRRHGWAVRRIVVRPASCPHRSW